MPTYQYRCKNCGKELEVVQSFSDDALTLCPNCHQEALQKVFSAVGVVFKGSGFYRTDSRGTGAGTSAASGSGDSGSGSATSSTSSSSSPSTDSGSTGSTTKSTPATGSSTGGTATTAS
ncbi:FmdB family zinc ribbon protein [Granulicoccus phenolivorans]|uniref:FmdB family zinc ribbon protein n=1 Tax=Granulicoccus phenolivorans TaxID=266854 RepID=UPI0009DB86D3|nr:FmdB family zinc ribbon protein [Granulicoccus phenolivorans]